MNKLIEWKNRKDKKPLLLKGTRQTGKTYLLKKFGKSFFSNYHYINFEKSPWVDEIFKKSLDPKNIIEDLNFHLHTTIDINKDLLIFDEIQECPKAITSLKYFQEDLPNVHICAAGSLLGVNLTNYSFPVGKVEMLNLRPMTFKEFLMATKEDKYLEIFDNFNKEKSISEIAHLHIFQCLKDYFITGGMPEAISTYLKFKDNKFLAFSKVREKQELLNIAYFADMTKHSGKINAMHLNRLFKSIPSQLEQSINGSASKFKFKGIIPGISHYSRMVSAIDWLENMGLCNKINIVNYAKIPLQAYSKENSFKLFLFDIGILGSMCNLEPKSIVDYNYGSYKRFFAENFVLQEFLFSSTNSLFCWHEKKSEIEFLVEKENQIIPIEVKSGNNIQAKSLKIFRKKYNPKYSIILSGKQFKHDREKNIYYIPLYMAGEIKNFFYKHL